MAKSSKGSKFEREIAKRLSIWITGNPETEPLIWRNAGSGSVHTIGIKKRGIAQKNMAGDLIAIDPRANFLLDKISIECKNGYKSASIFSLFKDSKSDILKKFWEQACRDAFEAEKIPWLIFKPLGNQPLLGLPISFANKILDYNNYLQCVKIKFNSELSELVLIKLEEFLNNITPKYFSKCIL